MRTHNYLTRINDDTWTDLKRIQELDNRSANSLINEGCRLVIADKLQKISQLKKHRNTLENMINVYDFHVGHDQPESKGGTLDVNNLKPICARCNLSMSDNYTIKQWDELSEKRPEKKAKKIFNCF